MGRILSRLKQAKAERRKGIAWLLDPDKAADATRLARTAELAGEVGIDYFLVGGSLVHRAEVSPMVQYLKACTNIPVVLFPGSVVQLTPEADGVLLLSLISGRNPELLIGQHVTAAPLLHRMELEVLPTGYLLVDGGRPTSATYMSGTTPLPHDKPELAAYTALAGQYLGLQLMYADTGSGAAHTLRPDMVKAMASLLSIPLWVGGGIRTPEAAANLLAAGADVFVVGTALEDGKAPDGGLLRELAAVAQTFAWNI